MTATAEQDPEVEFQVESEIDTFGRQFIRVFPVVLEDTPTEKANPEDLAPEAEEALVPLLPTPFIALPRSQREFHGGLGVDV